MSLKAFSSGREIYGIFSRAILACRLLRLLRKQEKPPHVDGENAI